MASTSVSWSSNHDFCHLLEYLARPSVFFVLEGEHVVFGELEVLALFLIVPSSNLRLVAFLLQVDVLLIRDFVLVLYSAHLDGDLLILFRDDKWFKQLGAHFVFIWNYYKHNQIPFKTPFTILRSIFKIIHIATLSLQIVLLSKFSRK